MKYGTRVKELCKQQGISVAKLERMAGIPAKSISGWDKSIPSSNKVDAVISALGISRDEFYEGEKNYPIKLKIKGSAFEQLMQQTLEPIIPNKNEIEILNMFAMLNADGQKMAINFIKNMLLTDPKYCEKNNTDTDSVSAS